MQTEKILSIIRDTRLLSLPYFGKVEIKDHKSTEYFDVVTQIDQDIEKYLKTKFYEIMPEVLFVGEEFGGERSDSFWLVDPIDGTGHYVRGIPYCTTQVALIENGEVVFSAIYDFVNDKMYYAEKGKGAYVNGEKISVSNRPVNHAYISCEVDSRKEKNRQIVIALRKKVIMVQHLCAGYEFVLVASGKIEGRFMYDPFGKDYDFAPGALLVKEAGGIVKNFNSDSYSYSNLNFIACAPSIYDELMKDEDGVKKLVTE